jgi:uncharacterized small protein (DUF1192 family)
MSNVKFPDQIYKSDSIKVEDYFCDFLPSKDWIMEYILINGTNNKIVLTQPLFITANIVIDKYEVNITSDQSTIFEVGIYTLNAVFSNTVTLEKKTLKVKKVEILEDLMTAFNVDTRNWAEKALDNVIAVIEKTANPQQKMYEIDGRKLEVFTLKELFDYKNMLQSEVNRLNSSKSNKGRGKIYIRFTNK